MFEPAVLEQFIGGRFIGGPRSFDNLSPVDGELVCRVSRAGPEDVDAAVAAARGALHGPWGKSTLEQRCAVLLRIADEIEKRFDQFVDTEVSDTGRPRRQARELDVQRALSNFRSFAGFAAAEPLEAFHGESAAGRSLNYAVRRPVGVVAVVAPWNLPILLLTWKVAPALVMGNALVVKPSEETPSSATLLAGVMARAGVPDGVFNLVHGYGGGDAGEWLCAHTGVDAVTFTGESTTGSAIMASAAPAVKKLSFELGGKNAAAVFADCDLDAAVAGVARSTFTNTGQVCLCSERIYVQRPVYDEFAEKLVAKATAMTVGAPDDDADLGPLISRAHRQRVMTMLDGARADGASFLAGGDIPEFGDRRDGGAFLRPALLAGLDDQCTFQRREVFGPVGHLAVFDDEEELVARVNDCDYGLAAALWTGSVDRAHRLPPLLKVGMVWVNTWFLRDLRSPFGGMKLSGVGREGGRHSLDFYSEPVNVCIRL